MKALNGKTITGTLEVIIGCEASVDVRRDRGKLRVEYIGNTEVNWDGQRPIKSAGGRVFVDSDGELWREQELISGERDASQPGPDEDVLVTLTARELGTVLAALRHWQRNEDRGMTDEYDIATDEGKFAAVEGAEIDTLCERLNGGEK